MKPTQPSGRPRAARSLAFVLASWLCAAALAAQEPEHDGAPPTSEILARILVDRDASDPKLFTVLARRDDDASQGALEHAVGALQRPELLDSAYAAFALYERRGERERRAIRFLASETLRPLPHPRRAATRALVAFGGRALTELQEIARTSQDEECRRIAIGGILPALEIRRQPEDLELLIRWYEPPTSGTRERGVKCLSAFGDADSLARFDRALDEREVLTAKKAMILDALARRGGEPALKIALGRLDSRSPGLQLAAVRALGTMGHAGHGSELARLVRRGEPAVRHAAFLAQVPLRAGEAAWTAEVLKTARSRDWALRMAAASALVGLDLEEAIAALHKLLEDPYPVVRRDAVRALSAVRSKPSIELLVGRMQVETMRNRDEIRAALSILTGLDHGPNPPRWARWWLDERAGFELPPRDDALNAEQHRARERELRSTAALFFGLPIYSDRLVFVLDVSGSMSGLVQAGGMRIDAVKKELLKALGSLPDGAWFNLLYFDDRVHAWKRGLVPMNEGSRAAAIDHARRQGAGGGTALFDALERAYADPDVDTIVLLSDGEPTDGRFIDPREILDAVLQWNVLREIVIHTVSVNWASELLRELARQTGGKHIEIR